MSKIKYLLARIMKLNYSNFFKRVNKVHLKTKKNRLIIFFDMIYCGLKYQAGYADYDLFAMYELNKEERKTILTRGINNSIVKKLNNPKYKNYFENKVIFNKKFSKYINREWLFLDNNFQEFKSFIKRNPIFFCKPTSLSCGKGIEKINAKDYKVEELYNKLLNNKQCLVEEVALQHHKISKLHPNSVNTLRVVTINNRKAITIVAAFIRIGNYHKVVDNFNNGGMAAIINLKTGTIDFPALDKEDNIYERHPLTKEKLIGFKIPMWEEAKRLCLEAAKVIEEIGYTAWDVCIGEKYPYLIEANEFPGHDIYQLPPHRDGNIGVWPLFLEAINKEK